MTTIQQKLHDLSAAHYGDPHRLLDELRRLRHDCARVLEFVDGAIEHYRWRPVIRCAERTEHPTDDDLAELEVVRELLDQSGGVLILDTDGWADALGREPSHSIAPRLRQITRDVGGFLSRDVEDGRWKLEV